MVDPLDYRADHRGLRDWLVQRVTALLIGAYAVFILVYFLYHPSVYFSQWHRLFHHLLMKVFTFAVLFSIVWHAWIGLWTVFTDYIKNRSLRLALEMLVILLLVGYLSWGFEILWTTH